MSKMKILLIITRADIGGAQLFVITLAKGLKELGYDVEVVAGDGDYLFGELDKYKVKYRYFKSLKRDFNIFNSFDFVFQLAKLIKENNYDIVHMNSSNALIGAFSSFFLKHKPKYIFTFHGLSFLDKNYEMNSILRLLSKLYFKFFLLKVDEPVFVSNTNLKESIDSSLVKDGKVIYYGLNENEMQFVSAKDARDYFSDLTDYDLSKVFLVGSAGRLAYQKNYDFLINNFEKIKQNFPDSKYVVVGDGPYRERFDQTIKEKGIQNDFFLVGAIKNAYRYMKAFDVFTLPSYYEGLPLSLIEAVMAEIPILASNVGGNIENVKYNEEQVFELNNIDDYLEKLSRIKNNTQYFIDHNKKLKPDFTLDKMVLEYRDLYMSLLNS